MEKCWGYVVLISYNNTGVSFKLKKKWQFIQEKSHPLRLIIYFWSTKLDFIFEKQLPIYMRTICKYCPFAFYLAKSILQLDSHIPK